MTRTRLTKAPLNIRGRKYEDAMKMDAYTRQLLETARRVIENSPYINNTKKLVIERLFNEIISEYEKEEN